MATPLTVFTSPKRWCKTALARRRGEDSANARRAEHNNAIERFHRRAGAKLRWLGRRGEDSESTASRTQQRH